MRQYNFRIPPGFILPGILGLLLLAVIVSIGMVLFAVIMAALVIIGIGSAIYRALFPGSGVKRETRNYIRIRRYGPKEDDIPFTDYKEIDFGDDRNESKE